MTEQDQEKVLVIMAMCMEITGKGKWHAFFNYSANTDTISVGVTDAAADYKRGDWRYEAYMDTLILATLDEIIAKLEEYNA